MCGAVQMASDWVIYITGWTLITTASHAHLASTMAIKGVATYHICVCYLKISCCLFYIYKFHTYDTYFSYWASGCFHNLLTHAGHGTISKCLWILESKSSKTFTSVQITYLSMLNLRVLKISYQYKMHIIQCMGKIFCVEFQGEPLNLHTKLSYPYIESWDCVYPWNVWADAIFICGVVQMATDWVI